MAGKHQYCTFILAGQWFGVEVLRVQEILRWQETTRVPLAPGAVRGLMNLRGQIVTAIDMRRRLGMHDRPHDQAPLNVVVCSDDGPLSLLVDDIGDVLEIDQDRFEPPPKTLQGPARTLIRGAFKLPDRLVLLLDLDQVANLCENSQQFPELARGQPKE